MAIILNIDTSTHVCSVCIAKDGAVEGFKENSGEKSHAKLLTIFIDQLLKELDYTFKDLDAIAISKGPGSYTGLRIGVSSAKGLCYSRNLPLIAINTLEALANGIVAKINDNEIVLNQTDEVMLIPMIDARRMEVYSAIYNSKGETVREVKAEIIDENSFKDLLLKNKLIFFGDGSAKIRSIITHENAIFIEDIDTSSKFMAGLSEEAFENKKFEDVAYFEPFYLKDFVATVPKKNIFN